jgi:hypothetical protein
MSAELRLADETPAGKVIREFLLEFATETITTRELIERRIREEVARYNAERGTVHEFQGLVQPNQAEATLNGYRLRTREPIDADDQCQKALAAFERNGFLLLANERQLESLDEVITVTPTTRAAFVKLMPLVGG